MSGKTTYRSSATDAIRCSCCSAWAPCFECHLSRTALYEGGKYIGCFVIDWAAYDGLEDGESRKGPLAEQGDARLFGADEVGER